MNAPRLPRRLPQNIDWMGGILAVALFFAALSIVH